MKQLTNLSNYLNFNGGLFLLAFFTCYTLSANADWQRSSFIVDNVCYKITDNYLKNEVAVTYDWCYIVGSNDPKTYYTGPYEGDVTIPEYVTHNSVTYKVTAIEDHALEGHSSVTSISLPNTITSIGERAFYNCSGLQSITLPHNITSIGRSAFSCCSGLTSITIPNSVTSIGDYAFYECTGLTSITIDLETPLAIDYDTFSNRTNATLYVPYGCKVAYEAANYWKDFKEIVEVNNITFADDNVKAICVANWDADGDGELSGDEAAAVTNLGIVFRNKTNITSFNELKYFTGLTCIESSAFSGCSGLTSVTIPNSVTSIGDNAFRDCSGLVSVHISDLVAWCNINFAISYDDGDIEVFSNPLSYAQHLFLNRIEIKDLAIPSSVTNIGAGAFYCYSGLTSVNIPNSVTTIGAGAFSGCSGLTSVNIPNSITSIGKQAFEGCRGLAVHITDLAAWCNINFSIYTSHNYLYGGSNPLSGNGHLFMNGMEIKDLVIPNSVTTINVGCFYGCSLTSINIPESVTRIGKYAFSDCNGLTSITIPNSVTSIDSEVFYSCSGLTSVTFGNGVTNIPAYTFGGCGHLKSVTFGKGLKYISPAAFEHHYGGSYLPYKMTWLSETPPNGYKDLEICSPGGNIINYVPNDSYTDMYEYRTTVYPFLSSMFEVDGVMYVPTSSSKQTCDVIDCVYDESVKTINIGKSVSYNGIAYTVKNISKYAFYENPFIKEAELLFEGIIDERAFLDCSGLTMITIGNSITNIGSSALYGTAWYDKQPDGLVYAGKVAYQYKGTMPANTSISIEEGTLGIAGDAFYGCSGLTSVTIPNSVTHIGEKAFYSCTGLTSVAIPNSVTTIGNYAFSWCIGLTSVTVERKTPLTIDSYTFNNCTNATLYVPKGSKSAYKSAEYWKEFKVIVEMPTIKVNDLSICKGGKIKLPISMENEEEITAFQFDVDVPDGITVMDVQLGERSSDSHTVDFNKQEDGSCRVIAVSLLKTPFSGNEGELVNLMLSADKDIESGNYNIDIKNIVLTTSSKEKIYLEDVSGMLTVLNFEQGDADGDGSVDVADVVAMIDYILDSSASDIVFLAADMNADGEIDIFDVMIAINIVLKRDNSAGSRTRASGNMEEEAIVTATADGIRLGVNDASRFTAFQFDVEMGDGMQLTDARLNGNAGNHELYYINNGSNSYRVIGVSMDNSTLTASGNDLIELSFSKGGHVQISNIAFVTPQKSKVYFSCGNGEVTGIGRIGYKQAEDIYDLSGRKVNTDRSRLPKGLYIINNKKVVIK